ncbi:cohesin domain-containing protein [Desulfobacula sp.]|uniref:cohesin domain-containing protein n=1 Tax=Desulfobacula sp. TaxID=2593537 RepID=UPI0026165C12|nr:cohesin domain-containing protein [Desulfobacula sp.]
MRGLKSAITDNSLFRRVIWHARLMLFLILVYPISLYAAADIRIEAASIQYVGGEFRVDIMIEGVSDLYGMAFDLVYDPTSLEVMDAEPTKDGIQPKVTEGTLLNSNGTDTTLLKASLEDNLPGNLVIGLTRSGDVSGVASPAETVFLSVYFRPKKIGTDQLALRNTGVIGAQNQDILVSSWGVLDVTIQDQNWIGDVNHTFSIDLADVILVLKALSQNTDAPVYRDADVNKDGKIGLEEAANALQHPSE